MDRGATGANICVWIDSPPSCPFKRAIRSMSTELKSRNKNWDGVEGDTGWWDVSLSIPLTELLAAPSQSARLEEFVRTAFDDLINAGLENALKGK